MPDASAMDATEEERGSATAGSGDPAAGGHIRALDGMRAVAVLLVLLFHLRFPGFSSRFLGVDIFFVLSGFLITTLLLTELDRTGRISLPEFWARRARRLLPALVVLLLVVAGVTWFQGTFTERASVRGDLLATTGYVANWHFINTSSYFADIGVDSPLEHTWSLAIEEQFYLLWPLVVSGVAFLWKQRPRLGVGTVAVLGSAISAGLLWSPGSVERAYMGTDARIFEPLVGAAGAALVATPSVRRWLDRWGGIVLGCGVLGLVSGILLIDASPTSYYLGGALLVTLATLMIVGPLWLGHGGVLSDALGWTPIAWIGVVSYGAYLWHWPLTVWLGARQADATGLLGRRLGVIAPHLRDRGALLPRDRAPDPSRKDRLPRDGPPVATDPPAAGHADRDPGLTPRRRMYLGRSDPRPRHPGIGAVDDADRRLRTPPAHRRDGWGTDRARMAPRLRDVRRGEFVRSGTARFWELRRKGLGRAVERLGSRGATVILVATEPPGLAVGRSRCTEENCPWWIRFQLDHYDDITTRWNSVLRGFAERHPDRVRFISVTDVICATDVAPCDDRIDGVPARPDGSHYKRVGEDLVIETLFRLLAPAMDPLSRPSA